VVELPCAADCCPCVENLRTVLPSTVGIRDGAVQLVSTLGSARLGGGGGVAQECSKGTYVRSLVFDIGRALGTAAHMTALRRERIGQYDIKDAWEVEPLADLIHAQRQGFVEAQEGTA
jgi:hypothetical protein